MECTVGSHGVALPSSNKILGLGIALNLIFSGVEIGAGILFQSLALISDALHNIGDVAAIGIGLWAHNLSKKMPDENNTFGYKNAESMAVLINSVSLIIICAYLMLEGGYRLAFGFENQSNGWVMFWVASVELQ